MCCFNPHQHAALLWAGMPTAQDIKNLEHSGLKRVLMPLQVAWHYQDRLAEDVPSDVWFLLRVEEGSYHTDADIGVVAARLERLMHVLPVHGAQLGNEWEHPLDATALSKDWGLDARDGKPGPAWLHRYHMRRLIGRLRAEMPSLKLVAQGWSHKQITESDPEEPGRDRWVDVLRDTYGLCDAGSIHVYEFAWPGVAGGSYVDEKRFRKTLDRELVRLERMGLREAYIDEANIPRGSDVEQMRACIGMMQVIAAEPAYRERVVWFSPFLAVGNPGTPPAWLPQFLIQDEAAYLELGAYVRA